MDRRIIMVDWDTQEPKMLSKLFIKAKEVVEFIERELNISLAFKDLLKTGKGYHLYLEADRDLKVETLILIQLALGSDWRRELYNHARRYTENKNLMFTEKFKKNGEVKSKEKETVLSKLLRGMIDEGKFYRQMELEWRIFKYEGKAE